MCLAFVAWFIEVGTDMSVMFEVIEVLVESLFDLVFGLAYILFVTKCAVYAVYKVGALACDVHLGGVRVWGGS